MNFDASTLRLLRESQGQSIEGKGNRHFAHFPQEELGDKIKVPSNIFLSWKQSCAKQRWWHNAQVPPYHHRNGFKTCCCFIFIPRNSDVVHFLWLLDSRAAPIVIMMCCDNWEMLLHQPGFSRSIEQISSKKRLIRLVDMIWTGYLDNECALERLRTW